MSASSPVTNAVGTATCRKLPPFRSSAICSPEPIPSLPSGTLIVPELRTAPPSRATNAPWPAAMLPALLTTDDLPFPENLSLSAMKSASEMSRLEATKPFNVRTEPVLVIAMPLGFTRYTAPLDVIWPEIIEVADPVTRLSVAPCAEVLLKTTVLPVSTEKLCQLITAFRLV